MQLGTLYSWRGQESDLSGKVERFHQLCDHFSAPDLLKHLKLRGAIEKKTLYVILLASFLKLAQ